MKFEDIKFLCVGWCKDIIKKQDKIWGMIEINKEYYSFYGRRNAKPHIKKFDKLRSTSIEYFIQNAYFEKIKEGYEFHFLNPYYVQYVSTKDLIHNTPVADIILNKKSFEEAVFMAILGKHK